MLNLKAKYEQLKLMLRIEGLNINEFEDNILGNYFQVNTKKDDIAITVYQDLERKSLEVYIEKFIKFKWDKLEQKYYKTTKGAYNNIIKNMGK